MEFNYSKENLLEVSFNKISFFNVALLQGISIPILIFFLGHSPGVFLGVEITLFFTLFYLWWFKTRVSFARNGEIHLNWQLPLRLFNKTLKLELHEYNFILLASHSNHFHKVFRKNDRWLVFISDNEKTLFQFPNSHSHLNLRKLSEALGHFYHLGVKDFTGFTPVFRAHQALNQTYQTTVHKTLTKEPGTLPRPLDILLKNDNLDLPDLTVRYPVHLLEWFSMILPPLFGGLFSLIQIPQLQAHAKTVWIISAIASLFILGRCILLSGLSTQILMNRLELIIHQKIFNQAFKHIHFPWTKLENVRLHEGDFPYMEFISDKEIEVLAATPSAHAYIEFVVKNYLYKFKPTDEEEESEKAARKNLKARVLLEK